MKIATIKDVAKYAGVSISSVSRVLNDSGANSSEMHKRVMAAVKALNYVPNSMAKNLKGSSMKTIALVVTNISNPFFSGIAKAAENYLSSQDYTLLICNTNEDAQIEKRQLENLYARRVDGILLCSTGKNNQMVLDIHHSGIPVILIDRAYQELPLDIIKDDNVYGSQILTRHLIDKGHRFIAFLRGNINSVASAEREMAFRDTLQKNGISLPEEYFLPGGATGDAVQESITAGMGYNTPPTAFFAANILIAKNALMALYSLEKRVPKDVALVCYGNEELKNLYRPSITCIVQHPQRIGDMSAKLMIERLRRPHTQSCKEIILSPDFHMGESV